MTESVIKAAIAFIATADAIDTAREVVKKAIDSHDKAGEALREAVKNASRI
jgi:hypothetical protein